MRNVRITALLIAGLACLGGCIEFEKQTILMRYDAEADVLRVRLVYEGIYAGGDDREDFDKSIRQLHKVAERGTRFFLMDNWPFEIDVGQPEEGEDDQPANILLRPHTTVRNGTFFLNPDGKLCAWQDIEIKEFKQLLLKLNQLMSLTVITGQADPLEEADDRTRELNQKLAMTGHSWFRIDEKGLSFSFALSAGGSARLKRALIDAFVSDARKEWEKEREAQGEEGATEPDASKPRGISGREAVLRIFAQNRISWIEEGDQVTARVSFDEEGLMRGIFWNQTRYVPNLLEPYEGEEKPPELPLPLDRERKLDEVLAFEQVE